jgi:hypothetical protein
MRFDYDAQTGVVNCWYGPELIDCMTITAFHETFGLQAARLLLAGK